MKFHVHPLATISNKNFTWKDAAMTIMTRVDTTGITTDISTKTSTAMAPVQESPGGSNMEHQRTMIQNWNHIELIQHPEFLGVSYFTLSKFYISNMIESYSILSYLIFYGNSYGKDQQVSWWISSGRHCSGSQPRLRHYGTGKASDAGAGSVGCVKISSWLMMSWGVTILSNIIGYCISCLSYTYHLHMYGMVWYGMYVCNVYPLIHVMIIL